jgi:hypothetical protein
MADENKSSGWTLKKEISLGDLIAFTSAGLAVIYAYSTLDSRVKVLEESKVVQQRTDQRQDEEHIRYQVRIDATLSQINAKLDRLVERR